MAVSLKRQSRRPAATDNKAIIAALHQGTWATPEGNLSWDADGAPQGSDTLVQWAGRKAAPSVPGELAAKLPPILAPRRGRRRRG